MPKQKLTILKNWENEAKKLEGRKIVKARYLTAEEVETLGWYSSVCVLQLDDGSLLFPSQDDEGNDGGALMGQDARGKDLIFPVINPDSFDREIG